MMEYKLLTGPDDSSFCDRVTEALAAGWQLHGDPALTFDPAKSRVICGQGLIRARRDIAELDG